MKTLSLILTLALATATPAAAASPSPSASPTATQGDEPGHGHGQAHGRGDAHGHAHGHTRGHGHDDVDREEPEGRIVELATEALAMARITVVPSQRGRISHAISLTGTVLADEDRTVHMNPKVEGLVRQVFKTLGDRVTAGEPLVALDSTQLGTAKVDFLKQLQDLQLAKLDIERKRTVAENVARLIALLEQDLAPLDISARTHKLQMGEHRAKLLLAYSNLKLAHAAHGRERRLFDRKVTSEKEMLDARKEYESAQAQYRSAVDEASYSTFIEHLAAEKDLRTKDTAHEASVQHLKILGATDEDLHLLRNRQAKELNLYTVRSPIDGTITEKHVTLGERVTPETSLFTISDLSTMWVLADVYEKDLAHVHPGMPATIEVAAHVGRTFSGKVSVVSPTIDTKTRTVRLRIAVANQDRMLAAGMFAKIQTTTGSEEAVISIPTSSVQEIEGRPTVFVQETDRRFRARTVTVGAKDAKQERVEVFSGLKEGEAVVATGAFLLRSELAKGEMGHDHSH